MLFLGNVLHLDEEIYIFLIKVVFSSGFSIPDYIFFKQNRNSKKIKINSFIPIPHPFPSPFFPSLSLPQSYLEMVPGPTRTFSPVLNSSTPSHASSFTIR
jgi:hypothetical protein